VRDWLTFTAVSWGAVQLAMGFVHTWHSLVVCRVLLGACEVGTLLKFQIISLSSLLGHSVPSNGLGHHDMVQTSRSPDTVCLRSEPNITLLIICRIRLAVFSMIQSIAAGLGPLFAYALTLLDGKGKLAGWRWIFVSSESSHKDLCFKISSGRGRTHHFVAGSCDVVLTPKQTALVLKRIEDDRGDSVPDPVTFQKVKQHLSDWTIWTCGEHLCPNAVNCMFKLTLIPRRHHVSVFSDACL
jgi:hypothetical protein